MTLFCSYYTSDLYQRFGMRMLASAEALGLDAVLEVEKDRGDWYANRQMMPQFILNAMEKYPWQDGVCWVDADALFFSRPSILVDPAPEPEQPFDIAGYYDPGAKEVFWAVLYFRNTEKAKQALRAWILEVSKAPAIPSHGTYSRAMKAIPGLVGKLLPVEYCCIRRFNPGVQPIIENQAISRLLPARREELLA